QFLFGAADGVKEMTSGFPFHVNSGTIFEEPKTETGPTGRPAKTAGGGVSRSVGQFLPGFLATKSALAELPALLPKLSIKAAESLRSLVAGAAAGTFDFDPHEPRLSNFMQETGLANPLANYLKA